MKRLEAGDIKVNAVLQLIDGELYKAKEKDPSIIPFTGVDFSRHYDFEAALCSDVWRGAKGMKLHPIIQNTDPPSSHSLSIFTCT